MKRILQRSIFWFCTATILLAQSSPAATSKSAKAPVASKTPKGIISRNPYLGAIVTDAATGKVLFEDQADAKGYPASMLKLIDLYIILEKIEEKQLTLQDQVPVSAKSAKTGGSQVWL